MVTGILEALGVMIMVIGGLLGRRPIEVDVITLLGLHPTMEVDVITLLGLHPIEVDMITLLNVHLMVGDQEGIGPDHILLDAVLKGTMHVVLGENMLQIFHFENEHLFMIFYSDFFGLCLKRLLQLWFDACCLSCSLTNS